MTSKEQYIAFLNRFFSLHPDNLTEEIKRLVPIAQEYEEAKKHALYVYETRCQDLAELKVRISSLRFYQRVLDEVKTNE